MFMRFTTVDGLTLYINIDLVRGIRAAAPFDINPNIPNDVPPKNIPISELTLIDDFMVHEAVRSVIHRMMEEMYGIPPDTEGMKE